MNIRRIKRALCILAIALTGGGVSIVMLSLWLPYDQSAAYVVDEPIAVTDKPDIPLQPALQDFVSIWDRDLRPPLFDPPVESTPEVTTGTKTVIAARPQLRLIGYTVETDYALAILMGQEGTVEFIAVGDELDGVTVVSITSAGVLLDHNGDEYTLKFDEESHTTSSNIQDARRVDGSMGTVGRYR